MNDDVDALNDIEDEFDYIMVCLLFGMLVFLVGLLVALVARTFYLYLSSGIYTVEEAVILSLIIGAVVSPAVGYLALAATERIGQWSWIPYEPVLLRRDGIGLWGYTVFGCFVAVVVVSLGVAGYGLASIHYGYDVSETVGTYTLVVVTAVTIFTLGNIALILTLKMKEWGWID